MTEERQRPCMPFLAFQVFDQWVFPTFFPLDSFLEQICRAHSDSDTNISGIIQCMWVSHYSAKLKCIEWFRTKDVSQCALESLCAVLYCTT